ncbi:ABC-2 type transport system permease protein [Nocardia amikacinitolerans]|uniref:ABC-2 type transport system permease protein n=2 Tax=Nocardia amikacinitolerans TaxID=756689 RepID=A0A285LQB1_9NOCA|nr:ABC-2 type transport system permease protein [Nocardia amikacinitolerans]MCP2294703.1 ABC-2 type transport system permease protein [Nocardia amikacinitolerans]MCP2319557.1 ABC-2 type transport system permease protein [Nocardia amikacinitolerans]SNY87130.1 ABC-2 type transport system permease protein [Nocardia amikacinitolerans]
MSAESTAPAQPGGAEAMPPLVSDSQTFRRAIKDMRDGFGQRELWLSLGWQDIKQRYRRSVLGPFWITIATGVQAAAMGVLYATLLDQPLREYLPYVTVGLIVWNVIQASILEGSEVFIANEGLIKQLPSALSVHVYRLVWRQLLFFAHNMVIYAVLLGAFGIWENLRWSSLLAIPAIGLIFLNSMWVSIVFGIFSTRYRDIAPILSSTTLMLFVLTPVMWTTKTLEEQIGGASDRARLVEIIPTFHYLEIVRAPLLGEPQEARHWVIVGAITVVGWIVAAFAMKQYRSRVPYWV